MKKLLISLCLIFMLIPTSIFASEMHAGNIMMLDETVSAKGTANGLVMLLGQTVTSTANGEYAFIAGQMVNISGNISKDAFIAAETVTVESRGVVNRDFYVCGSKVIINGAVNGKLYVVAEELVISDRAYVRDDIKASVGKITIAETAFVDGVVEFTSETQAQIPETVTTNIIEVENEAIAESTTQEILMDKALNAGTSLLLFILLLIIAPAMFTKIDEKYKEKSLGILKLFGLGLLMLIIIPILSILLMFTIIGIPASVILLLVYTSILIAAPVIAGYALARIIFKGKLNKVFVGVIGITLLELLKVVPYLGVLVSFFTAILALGVATKILRNKKKELIYSSDAVESVDNTEIIDSSVIENDMPESNFVEIKEEIEEKNDTNQEVVEEIKADNVEAKDEVISEENGDKDVITSEEHLDEVKNKEVKKKEKNSKKQPKKGAKSKDSGEEKQ